jgi:hypothetical protein
MIDKIFSDRLEEHPFAKGNQYDYSFLEPSFIRFSEQSKNVALIYKEPRGFHQNGFLMYTEAGQLRSRTLNKERLSEIINTAHALIKVKYNNETFLAGKGVLSLFDEEYKTLYILLIAMIPNKDSWTENDITFYVSKRLRRKEYKELQMIIDSLLDGNKGDIIYTEDISRYVGEKIEIPAFNTLSERRNYVNDLINYCLQSEKIKLEPL